jgi:hypothetical protein
LVQSHDQSKYQNGGEEFHSVIKFEIHLLSSKLLF